MKIRNDSLYSTRRERTPLIWKVERINEPKSQPKATVVIIGRDRDSVSSASKDAEDSLPLAA